MSNEHISTIDTAALYADSTLSHDLIAADLERSLCAAKCHLQGIEHRTDAQEARLKYIINFLWEHNMRLVASIIGRPKPGGWCQWEDLMQSSAIGLHTGIMKFDTSRNLRLSTYVYAWIRQAFGREEDNNGRTIRIPVHVTSRLTKILTASEHHEKATGRKATDADIAALSDIDEEKVTEIRQLVKPTLSLNRPVNKEDDLEFGDLLPNEDDDPCDQIPEQSQLKEVMADIVMKLPPREATVIRRRFGLDSGEGETLESVAQDFGLTRERIRQIEVQAMKKLRHPRVTRQIRDFA